MKNLTYEEVIALIEDIIKKEGSQAKAAKKIGVSSTYLGDVVRGTKTLGPSILAYFGIEREIVYKK